MVDNKKENISCEIGFATWLKLTPKLMKLTSNKNVVKLFATVNELYKDKEIRDIIDILFSKIKKKEVEVDGKEKKSRQTKKEKKKIVKKNNKK